MCSSDLHTALTCTFLDPDGAVWFFSCRVPDRLVTAARPAAPSCPVGRWETVAVTVALTWLTSPDDVGADLRVQLTACWRDVANSGGAVGFAQRLPVADAVVRPVLDATIEAPGSRLLVARADGAVAGWLVVTTNPGPVSATGRWSPAS